ncbi:hypothetical protein F0U62_16185 [Cystobacter fuscus]|uniref:hypothetical protein n=1 Tax=Cystobacter fuscus TaxID=43 RepID=UPI002B2C8E4A|nr:hypothetical protein F0U62_16185 [Cystobacter fuscus]
MAKNHVLRTARRPVREKLGALLVAVVALVLWGGCSTAESALPEGTLAPVVLASATAEAHQNPLTSEGCDTPPPGWPAFSSSTAEQLLAPFFSCTSPAAFVALQRRVDMARLVRALDDWSAVLRILSEDKRLGQTLGQMAAAHEQLRRRGINLADYPDRPERFLEDSGRGALEGAGELLTSSPMFQTGPMFGYVARKQQLPPPYRHALDEVENTLAKKALEPSNVLLDVLDELTFGVPLGFYHLAAGFGHGVYSLTQGEYEQATRELTPTAILVALYAGGKGSRYLSKARALQGLELRLEELKATAERLRGQLGSEGLPELARYLRADPEAALLVAEGGEAGAAALYKARGNVPKAQAWLSEMKSDRSGTSRTRGGAGRRQGDVAFLADDAAGLSREVLETKLLELELEIQGPRLSGDVAMLEKQLTALEKNPPAGATSHPIWSEYLEYGRERLTDLRQGTRVRKGRTLEPPLKWEGYQQLRGLWLRGLSFERDMATLLRDDAALPRAQRRFLQDFEAPRVETYVGVRKPTTDLRFADVLVIEQRPLPGQHPRVETFSFKSRDFSGLKYNALEAQLKADAREALRKYGETFDIRRPGLEGRVKAQRVRLIYEGGELKPRNIDELKAAVDATEDAIPDVEVFFR